MPDIEINLGDWWKRQGKYMYQNIYQPQYPHTKVPYHFIVKQIFEYDSDIVGDNCCIRVLNTQLDEKDLHATEDLSREFIEKHYELVQRASISKKAENIFVYECEKRLFVETKNFGLVEIE